MTQLKILKVLRCFKDKDDYLFDTDLYQFNILIKWRKLD